MGESEPAGRGTIAKRLDWLIRNKHPDGNGPSGYDEIARRSREYAAQHPGAPTISHQTVLNIRTGKVTNPGVDSLRALANVYGVKVTYFLDEDYQAATSADSEITAPAKEARVTLDLAARLNRLFGTMHRKDGSTYTNKEVAEAICARGGRINEEQIAALRTGARDPMGFKDFKALASFFGVPASYFIDDEVPAAVAADLDTLDLLRGVGARAVTLRMVAELDEDALNALAPVIMHLQKAEKRQRM